MAFSDAFITFPVLAGNRVVLREIRQGDAADFLSAYRSLEDIPWWEPTVRDLQEAFRYIEARKEAFLGKHRIFWSITLKSDDRFLGGCSLTYVRRQDNYDLGYWLGKEHWGKGLVLESVKMVVDYAFGALALPAIVASVHKDNKRSINVMNLSGFQPAPSGTSSDGGNDAFVFYTRYPESS